jgi:hypothetical protein
MELELAGIRIAALSGRAMQAGWNDWGIVATHCCWRALA